METSENSFGVCIRYVYNELIEGFMSPDEKAAMNIYLFDTIEEALLFLVSAFKTSTDTFIEKIGKENVSGKHSKAYSTATIYLKHYDIKEVRYACVELVND